MEGERKYRPDLFEHAIWCDYVLGGSSRVYPARCNCYCLFVDCLKVAEYEDLIIAEENGLPYWTRCCSDHKSDKALVYNGTGTAKLHP